MAGTFYQILGVQADASAEEIAAAYRALCRRHHPDLNGGDPSAMQALNAAYAVLRDPAKRRAYDVGFDRPYRPRRTVQPMARAPQPRISRAKWLQLALVAATLALAALGDSRFASKPVLRIASLQPTEPGR